MTIEQIKEFVKKMSVVNSDNAKFFSKCCEEHNFFMGKSCACDDILKFLEGEENDDSKRN